MYRRLSIVVFSLIVLSLPAWAAEDPDLGTWKLNIAKTKYYNASFPTPKGPSTVMREATADGGLKTTTNSVDTQGRVTHTEFTAKYDGKDYPVKGSLYRDSVSLTRVNSDTTIQVEKKGGNIVRMIYRVVAKDGKTSTAVLFGAFDGYPPFSAILVYDKQ